MRNKLLLLLVLPIALSCKKHQINSLFDKNSDEINIKSLSVHPLGYCNEGNPIGGGSGYTAMINSAQADIVISASMTPSSFKSLIESSANKTIYINPNVTIDLTNLTQPIYLPSNIVIASNRGVGGSLGALITTVNYCTYGGSCPFPVETFISNGNNIRFTGIRLKGPFDQEGVAAPKRAKVAILMNGNDGLEVDNCEISAWPEAAIYIGSLGSGNQSNNNNFIHHNFIYSNRQKGLGYGVCVNNGFAYIQANIFQGNRHDISCSGSRNTNNTGYEASCNIVMQGGTDINFDVHGEDKDTKPNASTFFYIHHNYFMDVGTPETRASDGWVQNIGIRGVPDNQCRIENNLFKQDGPQNAIKQGSTVGTTAYSYGNLLVFNNIYGYELNSSPGSYLGWYIKANWNTKRVNNFMRLESYNDDLMASIGDPAIIDYAFGDYNGDGKTDIYKIHNGALYVIPYKITNGLTQTWTQINTTTYLMNQLRFGYFNADNVTDMVVKDGNTIYVSYGCNTPWVLFNSTSYPMSSIYSGDLTGDGIDDFFCAASGSWMMINNATPNSSWVTIANKNENSNVLKLGWFDLNTADNKIDVFHADGINFYSSYNGTQNWTTLTNSSYVTTQLSVFDFDSDGVSDVIHNTTRQVSLKGRMSWANTTLNNFPRSSFTYGDLH